MKVLKYIVLILLILFIGSSTYVAVQPSAYDVSRTRTIEAPSVVIYNEIIDFKNWSDWSPWVEKDPTLTFTYPEQTRGVDGSYSWEGKDGKGSMKTLAAVDNDSIWQELKFENFPPTNVYWKLNKNGQHTDVNWGMTSEEMGFIMKFFALISGGIDNMIGPDYERGLEKLDSLIVKKISEYSITVDGIKEYGGGFYLYKTTNATNANISSTMAKQYGSIGAYMAKNQIAMHGMPFTIYQEMNMEEGTVIMSNGIPVSQKIDITDDSGILCGFIPKTKVLKTTLKGNYTNLSEGWKQAMEYSAKNNLTQSEFKPFEIYTNDPGQVPNPADWITEIYIPITE
ncbi:MAG: SRPBCC family protein [Bacteroidia bacterium]|nr:SRPBCC family protein [Bacteroidia bacterium]